MHQTIPWKQLKWPDFHQILPYLATSTGMIDYWTLDNTHQALPAIQTNWTRWHVRVGQISGQIGPRGHGWFSWGWVKTASANLPCEAGPAVQTNCVTIWRPVGKSRQIWGNLVASIWTKMSSHWADIDTVGIICGPLIIIVVHKRHQTSFSKAWILFHKWPDILNLAQI